MDINKICSVPRQKEGAGRGGMWFYWHQRFRTLRTYQREHGKTTTKQAQTPSWKQINNPVNNKHNKQTNKLIPASALFISGSVSTNNACLIFVVMVLLMSKYPFHHRKNIPQIISYHSKFKPTHWSHRPCTLYSSGNIINPVSALNR